MELKTIFRIHGSINERDFPPLGDKPSRLIESNRDADVNEFFAKGWQLLDMVLHIENGVMFDAIYLGRDEEDAEEVSIVGDFHIGDQLDDDWGDLGNLLNNTDDN